MSVQSVPATSQHDAKWRGPEIESISGVVERLPPLQPGEWRELDTTVDPMMSPFFRRMRADWLRKQAGERIVALSPPCMHAASQCGALMQSLTPCLPSPSPPECKTWSNAAQVQITKHSSAHLTVHDPNCNEGKKGKKSPALEVRDNICAYLGISAGSKKDLPVDRASLPVQVRGLPPFASPPPPSHSL
jgi:hypothetical protein